MSKSEYTQLFTITDQTGSKRPDILLRLYNVFIDSLRSVFGLQKINSLTTLEEYLIDYIYTQIQTTYDQCPKKQEMETNGEKWVPEWKTCADTCKELSKMIIKYEMKSTVFTLKCLAESILIPKRQPTDRTPTIVFTTQYPDNLTGRWEDDKHIITIARYGNVVRGQPGTGRLIMGLGPSASGKTHWAKQIVDTVSETSAQPLSFISIDGGIYRESSLSYQVVRQVANRLCLAGFSNLMSASFFQSLLGSPSLFESGNIKKRITGFLKQHTSLPICLYVPETLGGCKSILCHRVIQSYIRLTGDTSQWIALCIWQHKNHNDCSFKKGFQCVGCTESGTQREIKEGKKYSNSAYENSLINGMNVIMNPKMGPGGKILIHNSGGLPGSISVIQDFSKKGLPISDILRTKQSSKSYVYIKQYDGLCQYISETSDEHRKRCKK